MIDFYTWTTPNGRKVAILLEESGLNYTAHPVNIGQGEQFEPAFLKISPNNKIPAIIDNDASGDPVSVFESGAILIYLAEKSGQFLPTDAEGRAAVLQWLMWQMGGFGPMLGQLYQFNNNRKESGQWGIDRFTKEALRLSKVLDLRLSEAEFVGGDYSIADMAIYPWAKPSMSALAQMTGEDFPNITRWMATCEARPALARGMKVPELD